MRIIIRTYLTTAERSALSLIRACLLEQAVILTYRDKDGVVSTRKIIPRTLKTCQNGVRAWYAWDLNRRDVRCFRVDGIINVAPVSA